MASDTIMRSESLVSCRLYLQVSGRRGLLKLRQGFSVVDGIVLIWPRKPLIHALP